jgi:molybdate transport system ATP-binding protein
LSASPTHIRLTLPRASFTLAVDLLLPPGGITVLFGASGSGKTSLLRCVAGLERARDTFIRVADQVWDDAATGRFVPPWQRSVGYVFQEASLFEHLDVAGNLRFGLRRSGTGDTTAALHSAIQLLGIETLLRRRVDELSGGERQRVAIARAIARRPSLLLLDEPLASLDQKRRAEILPWLGQLRDESLIPMLYVTHSADELARLADTLVVLDGGRATACGPVADVLSQTDAPVVVGEDAGALLMGRVAARDLTWHLVRVDFAGGSLWLRDTGLAPGRDVRIRVLARDVSLTTVEPRQTSIQNLLPCTVSTLSHDTHPSQVLVGLQCGPCRLLARITRRAAAELELQPGLPAWAQVKAAALIE